VTPGASPGPLNVLIASYLEDDHVAQMRRVDGVRVTYDASLLPKPRYVCDHVGAPHARTADEERRWRVHLAEADVLFDFDYGNLKDLASLIPRVRWIQGTSTGIGDLLMRTGLINHPIVFTTARGAHAKPLADFVALAVLWFAKDAPRMIAGQAAHRWQRYCGRSVVGATVGIIGMGSIGREVARLCKALGMRVVATSRTATTVREGGADVDRVVPLAQLHALLGESDYVVMAVPRTPETEGMIGRAEIATMKPGAVFINIARGVVVDEPALIAALTSGHLGGAALDVASKEPPEGNNPLWDMPNVLISPHSASTVTSENAYLTDLFCQNLRRFQNGAPLINVFDTKKLY
jgi:phosphoglycerate dehydrogenase-like enzyme